MKIFCVCVRFFFPTIFIDASEHILKKKFMKIEHYKCDLNRFEKPENKNKIIDVIAATNLFMIFIFFHSNYKVYLFTYVSVPEYALFALFSSF